MAKSFRPGVGNIADYTEGKLRKKIIQYSDASSGGEVNTAANVGDPGADGVQSFKKCNILRPNILSYFRILKNYSSGSIALQS